MTHILALDQGTTSTRAILFDAALRPVASAQQEFPQHFPPRAGSSTTPKTSGKPASPRAAPRSQKPASPPPTSPPSASPTSARPRWSGTAPPASRSTTPSSGRTAAPPRPAPPCARPGTRRWSPRTTGLLLDPYFSATKLTWLLDTIPGARARAETGELAFGTVDSFLIWRLTGGRVHATDATNAARTMLYNIDNRRLGRRNPAPPRHPRRPAARGPRLRRRFRHHRARPLRRADPDPRHRRRPAGRDPRPGLLPARHDEIDLRHRLLRADEHRRRPASPRRRGC